MRGILDKLMEKYTDIYYLGCSNSTKHPVHELSVDNLMRMAYYSSSSEVGKPSTNDWKSL